MQRIKKDDLVQVISGNQKGDRGTVEEVLPAWHIDQRTRERIKPNPSGNRVRVEGINIRKKHRKPGGPNQRGEVVEIRTPIHISNVMLVCPKCNEATRTGFRFDGDKKVRYCKQCDASID